MEKVAAERQAAGMNLRSVEDLRRAEDAGVELAFLHFWEHASSGDGAAGPWCLSQWWPAPFTVNGPPSSAGRMFATAEHYMMWRKARLFDDDAVAAAVLETTDPARAKALGREVASFSTQRWAQHRFDAVVAGNLAKFGQNPDLRRYLLGTGDQVLVEASPEDEFWGIGLAADHPDAFSPSRRPGTNLLGFALIQVRAALRHTAGPPTDSRRTEVVETGGAGSALRPALLPPGYRRRSARSPGPRTQRG